MVYPHYTEGILSPACRSGKLPPAHIAIGRLESITGRRGLQRSGSNLGIHSVKRIFIIGLRQSIQNQRSLPRLRPPARRVQIPYRFPSRGGAVAPLECVPIAAEHVRRAIIIVVGRHVLLHGSKGAEHLLLAELLGFLIQMSEAHSEASGLAPFPPAVAAPAAAGVVVLREDDGRRAEQPRIDEIPRLLPEGYVAGFHLQRDVDAFVDGVSGKYGVSERHLPEETLVRRGAEFPVRETRRCSEAGEVGVFEKARLARRGEGNAVAALVLYRLVIFVGAVLLRRRDEGMEHLVEA
mmetsp:Transcript_24656/g.72110  ORF Transcript_24656/g.72110 Transcript_24656/m.72110 type:complete len:294 (+) Transcript_24656:262-1143(+)